MKAIYVFVHCLIINLILLLSLGCATPVKANEITTSPKIGVALSGGGARGLAHIGVLEALEQLNVPIHAIAGTSMGSIIGGLYASGMRPQTLRKIVEEEIDWKRIFSYTLTRDQLPYRRKQIQERFFDLEFGLNAKGLTTPPGFIGGQALFLVLKRLTQGIYLDDFAQLPIPFKAVATDLNAAKPYLLEKGDLAQALRASMAVPFAFSPVEIDGHVLADGGIINNIPVDVVRDMGMDIVIAVDIGNPLKQVNASSSLLSIAEQSLDVSLVQNALQALQKADIVIVPDLAGFSRTDFDKGVEMFARGYQAVMEKALLFKKLAVDAQTYAAYQATLRQRIPTPLKTVTPDFILFKGHQRSHPVVLQQQLNDLVGQTLSAQDIAQATQRLMSLGEFEQVTYEVMQNNQGETGLQFNVHEKSWGPHYFRLGANAATTFDDKTELTLLLRHESLNINTLGAEWTNELEVGTGYALKTEFYQPLTPQRRFFIAPFATFQRAFTEVFADKHSIAEYDVTEFQLGIDLGVNFNKSTELRLGIQQNDKTVKLRVGEASRLPTGNNRENVLTVKFGYDDLDDWLFAQRGSVIDITGQFFEDSIGSDQDYQQITLYGRQHWLVHKEFTLISDFTLATALRSTPPEYAYFSVGGFEQLAGYALNEISGRQALVARWGGLWGPLTSLRLGTIEARWLGLIHVGNAWHRYEDFKVTDLHYGGLTALVWNTGLGAISLGMGYTDGGSLHYYLSLGRLFN